jgi:3-hydroxyisobutyrate dehydrogenase-like beta-hydroxyacid dehydrogenase
MKGTTAVPTTSPTQIYVAGMGKIGAAVAHRLLDLGHPVIAAAHHDRTWCGPFVEHGGTLADTAEEALSRADIAVIAVPDFRAASALLLSGDTLREEAGNLGLVVNHATIHPAESQAIDAACASAGIAFVDAPVSGGPARARDGDLTIAASGTPEAQQRAADYLAAVASKVFDLGEVGRSQVAKLCNNMINAVAVVANGEALAIGSEYGLPMDQLREYVLSSSGYTFSMDKVLDKTTLRGVYDEPLFALAHMCKDLELLRRLRSEVPVRASVSAVTQEIFDSYRARGHGDDDFSIVTEAGRA